jgi:hypothetical protein
VGSGSVVADTGRGLVLQRRGEGDARGSTERVRDRRGHVSTRTRTASTPEVVEHPGGVQRHLVGVFARTRGDVRMVSRR